MEEVIQSCEQGILPIKEDTSQISIPKIPIPSTAIGGRANTHEIVQVDFIYAVILLGSKIKLIGHLVGEEPCMFLSLSVSHRPAGEHCENGQEEGENIPFHCE